MDNITNDKTIAVFIDADNTQPEKINLILQKISTYGRIIIKRAYGNWKKEQLKPWFEVSKKFAIMQVQQTDYVSGKNASDIALIIDAMDCVSRSDCDMFVIVSSDSDFTPLAMKLRELNKNIVGVGKKGTTIEAFINACDDFIFVEDIKDPNTIKSDSKIPPEEQKLNAWLEQVADNNQEEFTNICSAGNYVKRICPEFNIKTYKVKSLTEYIENRPNIFVVNKRNGKGGATIVEYKMK